MVSDGMTSVLQIIDGVLSGLYLVYLWSGMALMFRKTMGAPRWPLANLTWYWSKWPAFVSIYFSPVATFLIKEELSWWTLFSVVFNTCVWWFYKDLGDDDDHKKLKKKVKEKVRAVGGKLVVIIPEPA
jgi:hypothetical protein